eukprot:TRINITY_DN16759_c0_g4_i1.p1 TRINITY_DN16759_c0_g4~~TRINITY_DN16759_c0_g4_i1.p1  ORF type:complete len:354 (-),score=68.96 TRINITY_DN16759_c0_g4_i1:245-1306(-)
MPSAHAVPTTSGSDSASDSADDDAETGALTGGRGWRWSGRKLFTPSRSNRGLGAPLVFVGALLVVASLVSLMRSRRSESAGTLSGAELDRVAADLARGGQSAYDELSEGEWRELHERAQGEAYEEMDLEQDIKNVLECSPFLKPDACAWTRQWNCPGQDGGDGPANDDGTDGYRCCCERQLWKKLPPLEEPKADGEYWSTGTKKTMKLYHQTSPEICDKIMASNFKLGKGGLCGKAIYFALNPEVTATKAITQWSHGGCMIEAVVDVGKQSGYYWRGGADWRFKKSCGGWNQMTATRLHNTGADSIVMRQGDGDEIVIFEPERILSKKVVRPFKCNWMCKQQCQKHWPSNCRR